MSILTNLLGLSVGGGISCNQITIALLGLALILAAVLCRRVTRARNGQAIILLNTLVILVVIDLLSLVIVKVWHPEELRLRCGGGDITAIGSDEAWEPLLLQSYGHFNNAADTSEVLFSLVNVFDSCEKTVYTDDTGVHLTAEGNRLVANQIFRDLRESGLLDEILTDSSVTNGIDNPGFTP